MIDNSIFEVSRNEYAGFIAQLKQDMCDTEVTTTDEYSSVKILSKNTGTHLCTRIIPTNAEQAETYYVFNIPSAEESKSPRPVRTITLETQEEVQAFFDILNKCQGRE